MSQVAVVGAGYVGLVTAACLQDVGHSVVVLDVDAAKVARLQAGEITIHEPGLPALMKAGLASGRLAFTSEPADLGAAVLCLLAVGTPTGADGGLDSTALIAATRSVALVLPANAVLAIRSTIVPGMHTAVEAALRDTNRPDVSVVHVPEFLAEGTAIRDAQTATRLVVGGDDATACRATAQVMATLSPGATQILTDATTASAIKLANNAFLATRVALVNEMARLADATGADVAMMSQAVGLDARIGPQFLRAGLGYGGSCFRKDLAALAALATTNGLDAPLLQAVNPSNDAQLDHAVSLLLAALPDTARPGTPPPRIALWGLAFKPDTNDTRDSRGIALAQRLKERGVSVVAFDPVVTDVPGATWQSAATWQDSLAGADALVIATEWPEFATIDPTGAAARMPGRFVLDGRDCLDAGRWRAAGYAVKTLGRPGPGAPA